MKRKMIQNDKSKEEEEAYKCLINLTPSHFTAVLLDFTLKISPTKMLNNIHRKKKRRRIFVKKKKNYFNLTESFPAECFNHFMWMGPTNFSFLSLNQINHIQKCVRHYVSKEIIFDTQSRNTEIFLKFQQFLFS